MVRLLIVADDFTGALDTGVHFSEKGIATRVTVSLKGDRAWTEALHSDQTEVLVIDAETRHIASKEAYNRVYEIVAEGKKAGVPYIYKKTDSALRGNIGAELEAAYCASGVQIFPFIPALPDMNRITRGGIQYIDGVPGSKSVFGQDPFEPVTEDAVKDVIRLQSDLAVQETADVEHVNWAEPGIVVFDAATNEELRTIGERLIASGQGSLLAGCAGLVSILPDLLGLKTQATPEIVLERKLFVLCGSVNPITREQLAFGEGMGYPRVHLKPEQKLDPDRWRAGYEKQLPESIAGMLNDHVCVMLDSNDAGRPQDASPMKKNVPFPDSTRETLALAAERNLDMEQVRQRIAETLGIALKQIVEEGIDAVILVTGGDTLLGFMEEVGLWELSPIREIRPGCVLTKLMYHGREYHIITKSGGFGQKNLLMELVQELTGDAGL